MGLDVVIGFKTKQEGNVPDIPMDSADEFKVIDAGNGVYSISTYARFYGIGYERGPWPFICGILMYLLQHENVETVWYQSDCDETDRICTIDDVLKISRHYMENGERPYRSKFIRMNIA